MKKVILVLALALMAFTAKAQFYVGGSFQFTGAGGGGAIFGIAPEVGYNINDNMAVGSSLGFVFGAGTSVLAIDPYFRYYFADWGPARFFTDAHFNFSALLAQGGGSSWGVGLRPGIAVDVDSHFSIVTHIAQIGYYGGGFLAGINSSVAGVFNLSPTIGVYYCF